MTGIELIAKERQEQIEKHGYDEKHDFQNRNEELRNTAICLLAHDANKFPFHSWDIKYFVKLFKKDRKEKLIIAGALIAAEIDRLQNLEK